MSSEFSALTDFKLWQTTGFSGKHFTSCLQLFGICIIACCCQRAVWKHLGREREPRYVWMYSHFTLLHKFPSTIPPAAPSTSTGRKILRPKFCIEWHLLTHSVHTDTVWENTIVSQLLHSLSSRMQNGFKLCHDSINLLNSAHYFIHLFQLFPKLLFFLFFKIFNLFFI